jgi:murein DD-endopeptidase MepM/ murein hydrolase activator NlpD
MTLGQWKGLQARGYNALGAYQFIPRTLKLAASELGLSDSTVMTPEVQGRLAVQLMIGSKRPRLAAYLRGRNNDLGAALDDLALEWASVHTRGGGTAYAGIGGNAASISRSRAAQALAQARQAFLSGGGGNGGGGGSSQFLQNPRGIRPNEFGSGFGAHESFRRHPHEGSDAQVPQGTPLGLAVGGQVVRVRRTNSGAREANGGYGNYIDVRLPSGQILRMAHLSWVDPGLRDGMPFLPNQMLARTGGRPGTPGAGRSTGPHLHHELMRGAMGEEETLRNKLDPRRHGGSSVIRLGSI